MTKRVKYYEIMGILFTVVLGILLHFSYEWSGKSIIFGTFSAVNESAWERLKLLFFPFVFYGLFEYFSFGENSVCFFPVKTAGVLAGLFAAFILFCVCTAVLGRNVIILDNLILIFGTVLAYSISYRCMTTEWCRYFGSAEKNGIAVTIILMLIISFVLFTFFAPHAFLFHDATTNTYGIPL